MRRRPRCGWGRWSRPSRFVRSVKNWKSFTSKRKRRFPLRIMKGQLLCAIKRRLFRTAWMMRVGNGRKKAAAASLWRQMISLTSWHSGREYLSGRLRRVSRNGCFIWKGFCRAGSLDSKRQYRLYLRLCGGQDPDLRTRGVRSVLSCFWDLPGLEKPNYPRLLLKPYLARKRIWFEWICPNIWKSRVCQRWLALHRDMLVMRRVVNWVKRYAAILIPSFYLTK